MIKTSKRAVLAVIGMFLVLCMSSVSSFAGEFLDPEQAFKVSAKLTGNNSIAVNWQIAKGYKLYRDQIKVGVESGNAKLKAPVMPAGITIVDPSTNEKVLIYHDRLALNVPIEKASGPFKLNVEYQGCAEDGLCYPPMKRVFAIDPGSIGTGAKAASDVASPAVQSPVSVSAAPSPSPESVKAAEIQTPPKEKKGGDDMSLARSTLEGGSLWKISLAFLVFGLLLSFTPCVLPMVPILSSIIVGEGEVTRTKSFLMAVAYCLGMALVYTTLGVAAGLAGEGLAGALQKPWVLVMFAMLLVLLSLSMFDVYQLQIPASLQTRLNKTTGNLKGGRFAGVFFMGAISALIVGPCVAAPLAGTLVYISQTKDVVIGGLALFSMAMGMSVPLLLIGLSAGSLLPKAGAWMIGVKYVFGLLLIAVAIWMVNPVLPPQALMVAWGGWAILCSVFAGLLNPPSEKMSISGKFTKALGLMLFVIGVLELVGAASGSTSALEPLSGLHGSSAAPAGESKKPVFKRIQTIDDLDRELKASGKPVMLDFYADWCTSCKEMEKFTFSDAKVQAGMSGLTILQVDVTNNTDADKALMKRFGLFGPPAIIFFDKSGSELSANRVIGFMEAAPFLTHLESAK
ncbi:MAG: protein-disulfide reductase DsbD [Chlorobiaceae bacterium]|nr:protein-disulfide reductase DsbD [Chlorobiaceae bacterium]